VSAAIDPGSGRSVPDVITELQGVTLRRVRDVFSSVRYQRSTSRAVIPLLFDLSLYLIAIAGVFLAPPPLALAFGVLAGFAVAFLFVWGHDACHGALFTSRRVSEVLGTMAMLPSLQMYRLWAFGHNKVHHGFTSLSTVDWIWRPMTPTEYRAASRSDRIVYRLERHPGTCALHYLLRVWWPGMVTFRPDPRARRTRGFRTSQLAMLMFATVFGVVAYRYGGGWIGVLAAVVVPFVVFTYLIALFVYLHHTHPDVPFFADRRDWSATVGQLGCSTVVRCSRPVEWLTHNIFVHTPHHVDTRIPFYRLPGAYADLQPMYCHVIVEYPFR
jgi:omega-6 fatty acid desaturase (delta-12 desaturase)